MAVVNLRIGRGASSTSEKQSSPKQCIPTHRDRPSMIHCMSILIMKCIIRSSITSVLGFSINAWRVEKGIREYSENCLFCTGRRIRLQDITRSSKNNWSLRTVKTHKMQEQACLTSEKEAFELTLCKISEQPRCNSTQQIIFPSHVGKIPSRLPSSWRCTATPSRRARTCSKTQRNATSSTTTATSKTQQRIYC